MDLRRQLAFVCLMTLPGLACSTDSQSDSTDPQVIESSVDQGGLAPNLRELMTGEISSQSQMFLADGIVTTDEMQSAVLSYLDCLRENGLEGEYAYDLKVSSAIATNLYVPGDQDPEGKALDEISYGCQVLYVREVDTAHDRTLGEGGGADTIVANRVAACLADVLGDDAVAGAETLAELSVIANEASVDDESGAIAECLSTSNLGPYRSL